VIGFQIEGREAIWLRAFFFGFECVCGASLRKSEEVPGD